MLVRHLTLFLDFKFDIVMAKKNKMNWFKNLKNGNFYKS